MPSATVATGVVDVYKMGIVRHIPEPPLPGLDGDKVDTAPDAVLRLASYPPSLGLAAMGGEDRATEKP